MIVLSSLNGRVGINNAMQVLKSGGTALAAVEEAIRRVEDNPDDHTVGYGGYPNLLGQMELDAAVMDGGTCEAGAVAALAGFRHPISVARKVMQKLPHLLLVGEGAARFAAEMGFERTELLTEQASQSWREKLSVHFSEDEMSRLDERSDLTRWVKITSDPERARGTVNVMAQDALGNIAVGVSTSGWAWKYPGRVGDSPIIGAGLYAHNRYGAAACTGMGEMAIRAGTARSLVLYLKMGMSLEEAGRETMRDLGELGGRYLSNLHILAMDSDGNHAGFSNAPEQQYLFLDESMDQPEERERLWISTRHCWGGLDDD